MATKSLKAKGNELAVSNKQLEILNGGIFADGELPLFKDKIQEIGRCGCFSLGEHFYLYFGGDHWDENESR